MCNLVPVVSVPITMVIGVAYGLFNPKYWYVSFLTTWWIIPFNIALDVTNASTSHNLFPFELIAFSVLNAPAIGAGWFGKRVNLRYMQRQENGT
ncbi:MAG: hypothetical protein ABL962_13695 [Fimbriimonadaceae bacterium]